MTIVAQPGACRWCGALHGPMCPHVKALEFDADSPETVVRVEFVTAADFPQKQPAPPNAGDDYPKLPKSEV